MTGWLTPANLATFGGWVFGLFGPMLVYLAMSRKSDVDESTVILTAWKDLLAKHQEQTERTTLAHQQQMDATVKAHKDEMDRVLAEYERRMKEANARTAELTEKVNRHETRIAYLEDENRALRDEKEGLIRQLAQKSQSEVQVLGPSLGMKAPTAQKRFRDPDTDLINKLGGSK